MWDMGSTEDWIKYQGMELVRYEFRPDSAIAHGNVAPACYAIYSNGTGQGHELRKHWITLLSPPTAYDAANEDGVDTSALWKVARDIYLNKRNLTLDIVQNAVKTHADRYKNTVTHYSSGNYEPTTYVSQKIHDGIDRKKWPNTWKWLVKFSLADDFHRNTRYDWRRKNGA